MTSGVLLKITGQKIIAALLIDETAYNIRFGNRLAEGMKSAVARYQQ